MSDGLFFTLIIGFFFIVWLAGGGPHRPISFAGPFITPITGLGETQTASGPNLSGKISVGGVTVGTKIPTDTSTNAPTNVGADDIPNTSPYAGKVFLSHFVSGIGNVNPVHEYLTLSLSDTSKGSVDITGWKLLSIKTGASATIPAGVAVFTTGPNALAPIELTSAATVISGPSPVNVSYEENECTNYLSDPQTYGGCVATHKNDASFLTGDWQIYLNESHTLWQKSDTIELVDSNGLVVDSFAY